MSRVALVALARPTFDLAIAERNFQGARNLLAELGAEVVGPADLVDRKSTRLNSSHT